MEIQPGVELMNTMGKEVPGHSLMFQLDFE